MLSELLRKEYKVKKHFMELETNNYDILKDTLRDRFINDKVGEIHVTHLTFRSPTDEVSIVKIIKDFVHLVYFENVEDRCITVVYFEGDYKNELINEHNKKVLATIEKLEKVNKELAIRSEQALTNAKKDRVLLQNASLPMPTVHLMPLEIVLNNLLSKSDYIYGGFKKERTNLVLFDAHDFKGKEWSLAMKKELICSLFSDLPIGSFHLNKFDYYYLVSTVGESKELEQFASIIYDGKQRLAAILSFLNGEFSVDFDGLVYSSDNLHGSTLDLLLQRKIVIYETKFETRKELLTRFNLLHNITD